MILLVASCGGSSPEPGVDDLAYSEEAVQPTARPEDEPEQGSGSSDRDAGVADDQAGAEADDPMSGYEGSGLPPVTTILGATGGDPDGLYRGIIGTLWPEIEVVAPLGEPPVDRPGVQPLTGLPGDVPARPAAVVKIDNGKAAVPQTGLDRADIVYEQEVEGGLTRLAAVFHSRPAIAGPVRSGRTTDVGVLGGLGTPLFLYSGANDVTEGIIRAQPFIRNRSFATSSGYWRDEDRRAPWNLMADTVPFWASTEPDPPPTQFHYRPTGEPAVGAPIAAVTIDHGATVARWEWSGSTWRRWQNGVEHAVVGGSTIEVENVVVVEVVRVDTGLVDGSGGAVPEFVFVGTGPVTVYTDGVAIAGTWTRSSLNGVTTLVDGADEAIRLTPGRTWVQIVEEGARSATATPG